MRALGAVRHLLGATVGRAVRLVLVGLVVAYRTLVSPLLGPRCRFHPSCSTYALEALHVHGAAKGSALAGWRLLRCNPWNAGGVDRVPEPGRWRPEPYVSLETAPDLSAVAATPGPDRPADDRSAA